VYSAFRDQGFFIVRRGQKRFALLSINDVIANITKMLKRILGED
jgi:hypothetical protein